MYSDLLGTATSRALTDSRSNDLGVFGFGNFRHERICRRRWKHSSASGYRQRVKTMLHVLENLFAQATNGVSFTNTRRQHGVPFY